MEVKIIDMDHKGNGICKYDNKVCFVPKSISDDIVDGLFKLSTVNKMAPAVVNFMLGYGAEQLGYEYQEERHCYRSVR